METIWYRMTVSARLAFWLNSLRGKRIGNSVQLSKVVEQAMVRQYRQSLMRRMLTRRYHMVDSAVTSSSTQSRASPKSSVCL
jgi:uncharacterized membrane protein